MQKWEYKQISRVMDFTDVDSMMLGPAYGPVDVWEDLPDGDLDRLLPEMRRLRRLGEEGWELTSVLHDVVERKHTWTYYLKREI